MNVTPSQLVEALRSALDMNIPVMIWGPCGVGKSAVVKQVAKEEVGGGFIDFRALLHNPVDLLGLPRVTEDSTEWITPKFLPREGEGVLFLDELPAATQMLQAACYGLVLDRCIGDYKLPDGWKVIAAGNPAKDRSVHNAMPRALRNRFLHLELEADTKEWCKWALGAGIRPEIISFVRFRPELIHQSDPTSDVNAWPTPRSWEMASKAVEAVEARNGSEMILLKMLQGTVGEGAAAEFMGFMSLFKALPSMDEIMLNPTGAPVPQEPSALIAIATAMGRRINDTNIPQFAKYLKRIPDELQVLAIRDAAVRNRSITTTREFTTFAIDHADLLAA